MGVRMVKIVCRRCQFRNDQYNLQCTNCGASLAPETTGQRAVFVRNVWIGVLAAALLVVASVLVVQRGQSEPTVERAPTGSGVKRTAPATGDTAPAVKREEIPIPSASSDPAPVALDRSDPGCPNKELANFIESSEDLKKKFSDGMDVAYGTTRRALVPIVQDLQATRRDYASLGGPSCTRNAHAAVEKAMTTTIDALLLFTQEGLDDASETQRFEEAMRRANEDWEAARFELKSLQQRLAGAS